MQGNIQRTRSRACAQKILQVGVRLLAYCIRLYRSFRLGPSRHSLPDHGKAVVFPLSRTFRKLKNRIEVNTHEHMVTLNPRFRETVSNSIIPALRSSYTVYSALYLPRYVGLLFFGAIRRRTGNKGTSCCFFLKYSK